MGIVIINRESNFVGIAAKYDIFLDNKKIDNISNGETKTYKIEAGYHTLCAENALIRSGKSNVIEFNMTDTKVIKISVKVAFSFSGIKLIVEYERDNVSDDNVSKYDKIAKLNDLKNKNIITESEFEQEKAKILKGE